MDISLNNTLPENERTEKTPERTDAPFSEIYELIFYNQSLVRSELEVLRLLIQKKMKDCADNLSIRDNEQAYRAYKRQAVIGKNLT